MRTQTCLELGEGPGRVNKVVDIRGRFRRVPVHEVFITAMTCRHQFTVIELLQLRTMAKEALLHG